VRYDPREIPVPYFLPDRPEVREELAEYYQAISRLDQGVGRLVQALKETGHWDDTLVLFVSDNGMPFPGAKTTLYEPGMHLPLIVRAPQTKNVGGDSNALVTWADLTPTILDFCGAKGPDYPLHGRSFLATLDRPDAPGWDEIHASHTFHEITMYYPMRVVRNRKYKLILNLAHQLPYPFASDLYSSPTWQGVLKRGDQMLGTRPVEAYLHRPRYELYDLENDPQELANLAEKPEHAGILKELQSNLKAWQKKTGDPWIVKYLYE
jgi:N-sulfoglucosamine sulfohydrolase